ncbi:MAG: monovalent cation/H(+) antiporter subunit G [Anaerolineales bacterium]|nr:monovalent cation/H(+) antiporter subunit G [Anaerolineales bacterium]
MQPILHFSIQLIALIAVIIGTLFSLIGVLGFIRLPDVYTRLHATGKVGVYGVVLLLITAVDLSLLGLGKALILIVMLMIAGPVATHVIASAAYRLGIPMRHAVRDDLAEQVEIQKPVDTQDES